MVSEDTSPEELSNKECSVRGKVRPGSLLLKSFSYTRSQ